MNGPDCIARWITKTTVIKRWRLYCFKGDSCYFIDAFLWMIFSKILVFFFVKMLFYRCCLCLLIFYNDAFLVKTFYKFFSLCYRPFLFIFAAFISFLIFFLYFSYIFLLFYPRGFSCLRGWEISLVVAHCWRWKNYIPGGGEKYARFFWKRRKKNTLASTISR